MVMYEAYYQQLLFEESPYKLKFTAHFSLDTLGGAIILTRVETDPLFQAQLLQADIREVCKFEFILVKTVMGTQVDIENLVDVEHQTDFLRDGLPHDGLPRDGLPRDIARLPLLHCRLRPIDVGVLGIRVKEVQERFRLLKAR